MVLALPAPPEERTSFIHQRLPKCRIPELLPLAGTKWSACRFPVEALPGREMRIFQD